MTESFQDHMNATGARAGYYVATIFGGSGEQGKRQRVLDHSSALFSQGFRWKDANTAELWLGSTIRTYRFHSERGEDLRAFVGTIKRGREMVEIDGYAPDLDRADQIMRDEIKTTLRGHNVKYFGVQWKAN